MGIKTQITSWWNGLTVGEKINEVLKWTSRVLLTVGAGVCVYETKKSRDLIQMAVKNIGDDVSIEVSDELIDMAVEKAANAQIARAVRKAAEAAMKDIRNDTTVQVAAEVIKTRKAITDSVAEQIAKECDRLHRSDLIQEVREEAAKKMAEKLDDKLDTITEGYVDNLDNMSKIYKALADKLDKKGD